MSFIKVKNVTKIYTNGTAALRNVSFDIFEKEIIGLLGVNGSGKTTLSSILSTLHPPTNGDIIYGGQSIFKDINSYRKFIGYCPQKPNLHSLLTVEKNLYYDALYFGFSHKVAKIKLESLLEKLDLKAYRHSKPEELSGGYQQRTMIARALMHDPKVIILDEPTVGLDPSIRRKLWAIIKDLNKTILLTTHYIDEAEYLSDRICILDAGQIMYLDTPNSLKKKHQTTNLEDIFIKLTEEESL